MLLLRLKRAVSNSGYYTKKLLWIDENSFGDKQSQYNEIKFLTGNEYVRINEKYRPAYRVRNNSKIIVTTNDTRPLAVKESEKPEGDKDNNFFFYNIPNITSGKRDRNLKDELKKRLGHYCRTELKERYDRIMANPDPRCRYVIPCPITELGKELYNSGKTDLELAGEYLAEAVVRGIIFSDQRRGTINKYGGKSHIQYQEISKIIKGMDMLRYNRSTKHYITALQKMGVLGVENERVCGERLGYKVLASMTDFPVGCLDYDG